MKRIPDNAWFLPVLFCAGGATPLFADAQTAVGPISITEAKIAAGSITPGDTPGYPATLSIPGSYILNSNLAPPIKTAALVVTASDVVIDLNGFTIDGKHVCAAGNVRGNSCTAEQSDDYALISAPVVRVTIKNGSVKGGTGSGIRISDGGSIQHVVVTNNVNHGVEVAITGNPTDHFSIQDSNTSFNGQTGVFGLTARVNANNLTANYNNEGLNSLGGHFADVSVVSNAVAGMEAGAAAVERAYARNNGYWGIVNGAVVRDSVAEANLVAGFVNPASSGQLYINDSAYANTGIGFDLSAGGACYSQISSSGNSGVQISGGTALTGTHVTCP